MRSLIGEEDDTRKSREREVRNYCRAIERHREEEDLSTTVPSEKLSTGWPITGKFRGRCLQLVKIARKSLRAQCCSLRSST